MAPRRPLYNGNANLREVSNTDTLVGATQVIVSANGTEYLGLIMSFTDYTPILNDDGVQILAG